MKYLPQNSLKTVYKSLIESRFNCSSALSGNCGKTLKHEVERLQDRALTTLYTDTENRNHDDCLRVQQLIDQQIAVTVFKSLNRDAPKYLKQMFVPLLQVHTHHTHNHSAGLLIETALLLQVAEFGIPSLRMFGSLKQ